jgi:hypothetical protein
VLVATAVAACSSSGSSSLTKAQVVRKADAICAKANRSIAVMYRPDPLDDTATAAALEKVLVRQRKELRQLRALAPPEADASDYRRWLTQIDLALDRGDASRRAIAKGDVQAATEANRRGEQIRSDADRFAKGYGMLDCAQR